MSLVITVYHHSVSIVMPNSDPLNRFFYSTLTLMMDSYKFICSFFKVVGHGFKKFPFHNKIPLWDGILKLLHLLGFSPGITCKVCFGTCRVQIMLITMLWSFEKRYYINTLKQELSTAKT